MYLQFFWKKSGPFFRMVGLFHFEPFHTRSSLVFALTSMTVANYEKYSIDTTVHPLIVASIENLKFCHNWLQVGNMLIITKNNT